ncbi:MAG: hypothetical protein Q9159_005039 [Coniocarpon cinnabarinum]
MKVVNGAEIPRSYVKADATTWVKAMKLDKQASQQARAECPSPSRRLMSTDDRGSEVQRALGQLTPAVELYDLADVEEAATEREF